jgi:hypothetical protein
MLQSFQRRDLASAGAVVESEGVVVANVALISSRDLSWLVESQSIAASTVGDVSFGGGLSRERRFRVQSWEVEHGCGWWRTYVVRRSAGQLALLSLVRSPCH